MLMKEEELCQHKKICTYSSSCKGLISRSIASSKGGCQKIKESPNGTVEKFLRTNQVC